MVSGGGLFTGKTERPQPSVRKKYLVMNKKHSKKLKRAKKKKKEKKISEEQHRRLSKQMNMFDRLPDTCSACEKEFPKTRQAHATWKVVVRTEKQQVRLFCPQCQELANKLMEEQNEV
jgi:hypothetical protein